MRTATVRDLRTRFPVLARWIDDGESVAITRRGKVIAHLMPAGGVGAGKSAKPKKPDIMKRLKEHFGDFVVPQKEMDAILDYNKGRY